MSDWVALCLTLGLIAITFVVLRWWQRSDPAPSPEVVRKAAHVSMGALAATFPWLFQSLWPGLLICALALASMIAMRAAPLLHRTVGRVTGAVERDTWGEFCFPIAVASVWVLSDRTPVLFVIPVILLSFADAAAALVGTWLGRHRFRTSEGHKSVEGSLAFLAIGSISTLLALSVLSPEMGLSRALLTSLLLGALLMVFEAIAWRGLDNLLLPLLAYLLLRVYLKLDATQLGVRLGVFSLTLAILVAFRRRRTLNGEGVLASSLFLYGAWALGDWAWLVSPGMVMLIIPWLPRRANLRLASVHGVFPVLAVAAPGLVLLVAHASTTLDAWAAYTASFAAGLSMIGCIQLTPSTDRLPPARVFAGAILLGVLLVAIPAALVHGVPPALAWQTLASSVVASVITCAVAFRPTLITLAGEDRVWLLRGIALSLGTACALALGTVLPLAP